MDSDMKRTVEALLFAAPEPLSLGRLQSILPAAERRDVQAILTSLAADYDAAEHAFQLAELGGGWRIVTRPHYAERIEELLRGQRRVRLSRASLETLAVVAYRQPCTRVDVEAVRGVNCGGSLATLVERGLIRIHGRAETLGRPLLYGTTAEFLAFLGVNNLDDLPRLAEIEALLRPRPADGEQDEDSPVPLGERRERLLVGMDALTTLIAESDLAAAPAAAEPASAGEWAVALGDDGETGSAHAAALDAALATERALLAELDEAVGELDASADASESDAEAAAAMPALARIARALAEGEADAQARTAAPPAEEAAWAAAGGGED
jgi:segregation and condensation protein B